MGCLTQYADEATTFQKEQVAFQILSAVHFLHAQPEPIVHRDIKPDNVLVKEWNDDSIRVKLGDFGLSGKGEELKTFCGTICFLAPEGYTTQTRAKYSPLVDIWAVGALILWLEALQMPHYSDDYKTDGMAWAKAVVKFARYWLKRCRGGNELLAFAIEDMLVTNPAERKDAWQCYRRARLLKSVANAEPSSKSGSPPVRSERWAQSEEGDSATPAALSVNYNIVESKNPTIHDDLNCSLGARSDYVIDRATGLLSSDIDSFNGSAAVTPKAECNSAGRPVLSVLEGSLWNRSIEEREVMGTVEREMAEKEEKLSGMAEQADGKEGSSSFSQLGLLPGAAINIVSVSVKSPSSSQFKRRLWDEEEKRKKKKQEEDEQAVLVIDGAERNGPPARSQKKRTRLTY